MTSAHEATVDHQAVADYARLCGDHNPVHFDAGYASTTRFGRPVAHGLLVASYVQTALTALVAPGGVSVDYRFSLRAPVPVGSRVTARATCAKLDPARGRAAFTLAIIIDPHGTLALTGEAVIAFPREEAP
ncbi:MaoC/PaaZ C-terminal domain-containing protein [Spirillospora sp. CA-255316]